MKKKKDARGLAKVFRRTIIPMLALMLAASPLRAQSDGLDREITLSGTHITLGKTMAEIQAQTPYRFAFNPDQIDTSGNIIFSRNKITLRTALDLMTGNGKYEYVLRNNFIALSRAEQPAEQITPYEYVASEPDQPVEPVKTEIESAVTIVPEVAEVNPVPQSAISTLESVEPTTVTNDEVPFVGLKTNILYDATATINLGGEFRTGRRTSLDVSVSWNPFQFKNNRKWKHILIQPEFRLWTKETFSGHFFGVHAHYAYYNVGNLPNGIFSDYMAAHRFEGWLAGVGVSYGYRWNFTRNWGLEATIGVGYAYLNYDKYRCETCGDKLGSETKNYFGPTKAGITLIYTFGKKSKPTPAAPVYIPPVVREPEPVVEVVIAEPQPEPQPQPTTAEQLAEKFSFLSPVSELDDSFRTDPERYIQEHREGSMSVYFKQGGIIVDPSYKDNATTLDDLITAIRQIDRSSDSRIVSVVIAGFASPEGSVTVNDRLAQQRAEVLRSYLTDNTTVSNDQVDLHNGGVDWHGLRTMVAASDMADRDKVLDIIDNTPVWDARRNVGRLGELMRLSGGQPYRYMLRNFFPDLRNAAYIRVYFENE